MFTPLVQQVPPSPPGWVGPTIAISSAVIALVFLLLLLGAAVAMNALREAVDRMAGHLAELRTDLAAVLEGARRVVEEGEALAELVRDEGQAYVATSRRFRKRVDRGIDRLSERVADLDALYEVVHEEIEDSALRFATVLRTARLSTGILGRVLRRRRRR
jgi:hypothetical protein